MKSTAKYFIVIGCIALIGACDSKLTNCDGVKKLATDEEKINMLLSWVDERTSKGTITAKSNVLHTVVFRPGNYSIATDFDYRQIGFTKNVTARVELNEKQQPISVFIGEAPSTGVIIKLRHVKDFKWSPVLNLTSNERVAFVCTRPQKMDVRRAK